MQSKAKDVESYLKELPTERKAPLVKLRNLCRKTLKGFEESMEYGMPCYSRAGKVEVAFASQRNYLSFYVLRHDVMKKNSLRLKPYKPGKSCIKLSLTKPLDTELVEDLLRDIARVPGPLC